MKNLGKSIKKWLTLAMTAVMIFAMAATAFADEVDDGSSTETTQTATTNKVTTGNYTLTVNKNKEYDSVVTYDVYQLFTANIDNDNNALYTATATLTSLFGNNVTVDTIAAMSSDDLYGLVKEITSTNEITTYGTLTTGTAMDITQAGYYLLIPTNTATASGTAGGAVSSAIFVAVPEVTAEKDEQGNPTGAYDLVTDVEVTSKSSDVTTDKAITDVDSTYGTDDTYSDSGNTATSGSGDTIQYTITNTVPSYNADVDTSKVNYYVVDTYDANLTIVDNSVEVTAPSGLTPGSGYSTSTVTAQNGSTYTLYTVTNGDYYVDYNYNEGTNQFTVYFNYSAVKNASDGVKITAQFTLDKTATPGTAVENKSELTYTNNYYTGDDSTLKDTVKSWTFGLEVYKYDTEDNSALAGATFGLYSDSSCSTEIAKGTSGNDGIVKFDVLLNDGTYYVKEITAPNGYRVDETVYTVVITADKDETSEEYTGDAKFTANGKTITSTLVLTEASEDAGDGETINTGNKAIAVMGIGNTAGTTLPGTGGIGTTIFTFGGLVLVILAAIMFIVYTKKQRKQA